MRTARLLPVSPSVHCAGGWSAPGWVSASGPGVSASAPMWGCVYPSMQWGRHPPPVDRIPDTFLKIYLAPTSLRAVITGLDVILLTFTVILSEQLSDLESVSVYVPVKMNTSWGGGHPNANNATKAWLQGRRCMGNRHDA